MASYTQTELAEKVGITQGLVSQCLQAGGVKPDGKLNREPRSRVGKNTYDWGEAKAAIIDYFEAKRNRLMNEVEWYDRRIEAIMEKEE